MLPKEFIAAAEGMAEHESKSLIRPSISRSYYGAYNLSVNMLEDLGVDLPRDGNAHRLVRILLRFCAEKCGLDDFKTASLRLGTLGSQRIKADYRLSDTTVENRVVAENATKFARDVERAVSVDLDEKVRADLLDTVKRYRNENPDV